MIKYAYARYGRLDVLCNNAGIGSTTTVVACEPDEWDHVLSFGHVTFPLKHAKHLLESLASDLV